MENFDDGFVCPYCNAQLEPDDVEPFDIDSDGIYGSGSYTCDECGEEFDYSFEQRIIVETYKREDI